MIFCCTRVSTKSITLDVNNIVVNYYNLKITVFCKLKYNSRLTKLTWWPPIWPSMADGLIAPGWFHDRMASRLSIGLPSIIQVSFVCLALYIFYKFIGRLLVSRILANLFFFMYGVLFATVHQMVFVSFCRKFPT